MVPGPVAQKAQHGCQSSEKKTGADGFGGGGDLDSSNYVRWAGKGRWKCIERDDAWKAYIDLRKHIAIAGTGGVLAGITKEFL